MILGQLLTLGNALTKGVSEPSPYRMNEQGRLPDFSKGLKPNFSQSTPTLEVFQPDLFSPAPQRKSKAPPAIPTPAAAATAVHSLTAAAEGEGGGKACSEEGPITRGEPSWEMKDGLVHTRLPQEEAEPRLVNRFLGRANTRLDRKTTEQKEQALQGVKPIRNDLNESDVEVVPQAAFAPSSPDETGQLHFGSVSKEPSSGAQRRVGHFIGRLFLKRSRFTAG